MHARVTLARRFYHVLKAHSYREYTLSPLNEYAEQLFIMISIYSSFHSRFEMYLTLHIPLIGRAIHFISTLSDRALRHIGPA
jgi:hypothetical protein